MPSRHNNPRNNVSISSQANSATSRVQGQSSFHIGSPDVSVSVWDGNGGGVLAPSFAHGHSLSYPHFGPSASSSSSRTTISAPLVHNGSGSSHAPPMLNGHGNGARLLSADASPYQHSAQLPTLRSPQLHESLGSAQQHTFANRPQFHHQSLGDPYNAWSRTSPWNAPGPARPSSGNIQNRQAGALPGVHDDAEASQPQYGPLLPHARSRPSSLDAQPGLAYANSNRPQPGVIHGPNGPMVDASAFPFIPRDQSAAPSGIDHAQQPYVQQQQQQQYHSLMFSGHLQQPVANGVRPTASYDLRGNYGYAPSNGGSALQRNPVDNRGFPGCNHPKGECSVLDKIKESPKRYGNNWTLADIKGHVVEFAGDYQGSTFIQQKLDAATVDVRRTLFIELRPNAVGLMQDVYGNYVIQKVFEQGDQIEKKFLAREMKPKMVKLTLNVYACRVVQKAIETILLEQKVELVNELRGRVWECVCSDHGNYVVQKSIEHVSIEHIQFMIDEFYGRLRELAMHKYGCRVVQRLLEHCPDNVLSSIMVELRDCAGELPTNENGNFVAQHIIEKGRQEDRDYFVNIVLCNVLSFSRQKQASNVVEACLKHGTCEQRLAIWAQIYPGTVIIGGRRVNTLTSLIEDPFGNYVVQSFIQKLPDADWINLFPIFEKCLAQAQRNGPSKVVSAVTARFDERMAKITETNPSIAYTTRWQTQHHEHHAHQHDSMDSSLSSSASRVSYIPNAGASHVSNGVVSNGSNGASHISNGGSACSPNTLIHHPVHNSCNNKENHLGFATHSPYHTPTSSTSHTSTPTPQYNGAGLPSYASIAAEVTPPPGIISDTTTSLPVNHQRGSSTMLTSPESRRQQRSTLVGNSDARSGPLMPSVQNGTRSVAFANHPNSQNGHAAHPEPIGSGHSPSMSASSIGGGVGSSSANVGAGSSNGAGRGARGSNNADRATIQAQRMHQNRIWLQQFSR